MPNTQQSENLQLREQLALLIEQARRNEDILRRHQEFDLTFISASGFRELIESIFAALSAPSELDVVTLAMLDSRYEIRRILQDLNIDLSEFPNLLFFQDADELGALKDLMHPANWVRSTRLATAPVPAASNATGQRRAGSAVAA